MSTVDIMKPKVTVSDVNTGIDPPDRRELADSVGIALAETYVLYLKTQGFHWNVVGPLFYGLHKLTDAQYRDLADAVDVLAERIRALGYPAPATFKRFLELSAIKEMPNVMSTQDGIRELVNDHEKIARTFRKTVTVADKFDDIVTADLLTKRMAVHETAAWMLRSLVAQ